MKALILIFLVAFYSFQNKTSNETASVKIGTQTWTSTNLDVSTFKNGKPIPEIESPKEFYRAGLNGKPAWCYYNKNSSDRSKYGKLYNWYAVHDSNGLAPEGWHIPTDDEWAILINYLGGSNIAGKKMKSDIYWDGNNNSGFNALPAGYSTNGKSDDAGAYASFWSVTEISTGGVWDRNLDTGFLQVYRDDENKANGFSVRCVHD